MSSTKSVRLTFHTCGDCQDCCCACTSTSTDQSTSCRTRCGELLLINGMVISTCRLFSGNKTSKYFARTLTFQSRPKKDSACTRYRYTCSRNCHVLLLNRLF